VRGRFDVAVSEMQIGTTSVLSGAAQFVPALRRPCFDVLPKLSRYTLVSVTALGFDLTVFNVLTVAAGQPTIASVVADSCGMLLHYVLSARFVFAACVSDKSMRRTRAEFVASGLVGLAMTTGVIAVSTTGLGLPAFIAKFLAVGSSFLAVYWLRSMIVFKSRA
jgi:putative flippase GtrA